MEKLLDTIWIIVIAIGGSAILFIGANKLFDLPRHRWRIFSTIAGALISFSIFAILWANRVILQPELMVTLATLVGAGVGYALGTVEDRLQRLLIGLAGGGVLGVLAGIELRDVRLISLDPQGRELRPYDPVVPELDFALVGLWTLIGVGVGVALWTLFRRRRPTPLRPALLWGAIGWLVGAFAASPLGVGTRANALTATVVAGLALGAWVGLKPMPDYAARDALARKARVYIFLVPALAFIGATLVVPTLRTIYLSFLDTRGQEFVGLENYGDIFTDNTIVNVNNWADFFGSRLTWFGVVILAIGIVMMIVLGRRTGYRAEVSPATITPTAIGMFLLAFGAFSVLRGTVFNNLWWVFTVTVVATALGLGIAVLSDRAKYESVAKSLIFMPMAISFVGAGIIWRFMFIARDPTKPQTGVLNSLWVGLGELSNSDVAKWLVIGVLAALVAGLLYVAYRGFLAGARGIMWGSVVVALPVLWFMYALIVGIGGLVEGPGGELIPDTILFVQEAPFNNVWLMVVLIWIQTGFTMVIFSAAIKAVPAELIEAAKVDGATESQTFWRVTIPQIAPTIGVVVTTLIVLVMKVFDIEKVMTNGNFDTQVIANEMWQRAFTELNFGLGSALAVALFVAVLPIMYINIRRMQEAAA